MPNLMGCVWEAFCAIVLLIYFAFTLRIVKREILIGPQGLKFKTMSKNLKKAVAAVNERIRDGNFVASHEGTRPDREMTPEEHFVWEKGSSVFNYYVGYVSNSSMVLFLLVQSYVTAHYPPSLLTFVVMAFAGLFTWTLGEYLLHRIPYHVGHHALVMGHLIHHEAPRALIGIPYYLTAFAYVSLYFLLTLILDPGKLGVFMAFFAVGYIGYCAIHHGIHHWAFKNLLYKKMKTHHLLHHKHPNKNFSITFPPWDYVFRTQYRS